MEKNSDQNVIVASEHKGNFSLITLHYSFDMYFVGCLIVFAYFLPLLCILYYFTVQDS